MADRPTRAFETLSIHAGQPTDSETGAVMTPIYASSTFEQPAPGKPDPYEYSRTENPTRTALEGNVATLEGGEFGRCFASGMAAIDAICSLLEPGDHVVAGEDAYSGTNRLFEEVYARRGVETSFVDTTDMAAIEMACTPETVLLWLESPTNPLLSIVDIPAIAAIADEHDALCVVDNTFATPYLQRPLDLGADVVVHSLTKYLGGHSDVIGGAIVTDDEELDEAFGYYQNAVGATLSPFDSFLTLRGTKTLPVRMDRHCENAEVLADWLESRSNVTRVYYPGLTDHPGHDIARKQMDAFGGMVSFELDGTPNEAIELTTSTDVFTLAESLGGVESLIELPAEMTHAGVPTKRREQIGVSPTLVRLSVGIEHVNDLQADLDQAIEAALDN